MPHLRHSTYRPPPGFRSGHVQSIYPALFRIVPGIRYRRERLHTDDGDFLDLDWALRGSDSLLVLSHGLEGSSEGSYIRGMGRAFRRRGWDVLAWNYRGCSGEDNRLLRTYHSGASDDLARVLQHVSRTRAYRNVVLVGFSLGGNLTLKYLGERGADLDARVRKAVVFSVPSDLEAASRALGRRANRIYMEKFLSTLRAKVLAKDRRFPGVLPKVNLRSIRTFREFDDIFTAPSNGFEDAMDYWRTCSANRFLSGIRVPTLLVNARNDPFLAPECFPVGAAEDNSSLFLETPRHGGHVGFVRFATDGLYWSERRALEFVYGRVFH